MEVAIISIINLSFYKLKITKYIYYLYFYAYGSIHVFNISIGGGAKLNLAGPSISNLYLDFTFESLNVGNATVFLKFLNDETLLMFCLK